MSFTYDQLKQAIQDYTENAEPSFVTNIPLFIRQAEERILKTVQLTLFRKNATATVTAQNQYLSMPSDYLAPFSLSLRDESLVAQIVRTKGNLSTVLLNAVVGNEPEATLFSVEINGRKLGDIDDNGSLGAYDALEAGRWEEFISTDAVIAYIETVMQPYIVDPANAASFQAVGLTLSYGEKFFIEFKDSSFLQTYTPNPGTYGAPKYYGVFDVDSFTVAPTPNINYVAELHYLYRPDSLTAGAGSETTWLSINAELALLYGSLVEAYIYMKGEQDVMAMYNARLQEAIVGIKLLGEAKETTQNYRVGQVIREKQ